MAYHIFHSTQPRFDDRPQRLALFDLDNTLITSKRSRRWVADGDDWIFQGDVPAVLHRYAVEGWTVAIITNQFEWQKSPGPQTKIKSVLDALYTANAWAPYAFVATGATSESVYRKPARGLYDLLLQTLGIDESAVVEKFMCGDAAGVDAVRPEYRWSDNDAAFAAAIGARFVTPDTIFGLSPARPLKTREIVILVGNMGSGKSTTASQLGAAGYGVCEQDELKTSHAMLKMAKYYLDKGQSVVIDATHSSSKSREPYIKLARESAVNCRILWHIRDGRPYNAQRSKAIPEVAYAIYSKFFEDPRLEDVEVEMVY